MNPERHASYDFHNKSKIHNQLKLFLLKWIDDLKTVAV